MASEEKAKEISDRIMSLIIPVKEEAIAKAERLALEGDGKGANLVMAEGLIMIRKIIIKELTKYFVDELVMKPLKETLNLKDQK